MVKQKIIQGMTEKSTSLKAHALFIYKNVTHNFCKSCSIT